MVGMFQKRLALELTAPSSFALDWVDRVMGPLGFLMLTNREGTALQLELREAAYSACGYLG